jgi:hypothetical protein
MAWCIAQSRFLTGPQSLPRVGDRVIGIKSLRIGIEQMYRPRISVPMLGIRQKIAIGGSRIDASQHRHGTLEDATAEDRAVTFKEEREAKSDGQDLAERVLGKAVERAESGSNNVAELFKTCWHGHCGHVSGEKDLRTNAKEARAAVMKAQAKLDKARDELLGLDESAIKSELRSKDNDYRKAVLASPLHRFASMIFGGDPAQQSDNTIAWAVRLWVGIPSALGACLSVLLTMIAIKPLPRRPTIKPRSAERMEILKEGAALMTRSATADLVKVFGSGFKAGDAAPLAAPVTDNATTQPPSPIGEAISELKTKRRGRGPAKKRPRRNAARASSLSNNRSM